MSRSPHQDAIDALVRWMDEDKANGNGHSHKGSGTAGFRANDVVIETARSETNGKFDRLWCGDLSDYEGDHSKADDGFVHKLYSYTQDEEQIKQIHAASGLSRPKSEKRYDYLQRSIDRAVENVTWFYEWPENGDRPASRPHYKETGQGHPQDEETKEEQVRVSSMTFGEMEDPGPQEYVWGEVIPKGKPAIIYGAAGTIKSIKAQSYGEAVADPECHTWLGLAIPTCNVMYADWELGPADQYRRAMQVARGDGGEKPPYGFRYMSTNGIPRKQRRRFVYDVLEECIFHHVEICIFDSLGVAIEGDPSDRQTVMDLFEEVVPAFEAEGITLWMIDHQRRLQPGEKTQSLGVYGTVLKEYLARAQIQVEFVSRDRENHTVTTRLRPKKAQFGELPEPVEVKTAFSEERITLEVVELDNAERATEETLSNRDRIKAALQSIDDAAGPHEIQEICADVPLKSIKNTLSKMRNADPPEIEDSGRFEDSGAAKVRLVSLSQHYKGGRDRDTRCSAGTTKSECEHHATVGNHCLLCPDGVAVAKDGDVR